FPVMTTVARGVSSLISAEGYSLVNFDATPRKTMTAAVTSRNPARLDALDALRAIGAIWVMVAHVGYTTGFTLTGVVGGFLARAFQVAPFFMLSGFLLFRPYVYAKATGSRRPGTGRFFWRRAVRILPAYWVVVAVCLTALPENASAPLRDWLHYGTLTQVYFD